MKLLNCLDCNDVIAMTKTERKCFCGKSSGKYDEHGLRANVTGNARILGMRNDEYIDSIKYPDKTKNYRWFSIT